MYFTGSTLNIICDNIRFNQTPLEGYIGLAKTRVKSGTPGNGLSFTGFLQPRLVREM